MATHTTTPRPTRLIPVTEWSRYHAWPPLGGLRHLVFHAETNGFGVCVRRVGRRVLIDEAAFFDFVAAERASDKHDGASVHPTRGRRA